ncbi:hypothetical protein V474_11100 [Novosphingobium barchaimii LL02]|uniref:Glycerophosphoryl diester phosphodiesterase membrane domain-containing protein n=1 Tax=Novosphingobium barchaimii LL02 TaxID=1114963 RepID=A0A0J7Y8X5_9SPHN|nr:hypothetical protein V474_11100 [Novosphingobium barchaimii LL02]
MGDIFAQGAGIAGRSRAVLAGFALGMSLVSSVLSFMTDDMPGIGVEMAVSSVAGYFLFWQVLATEGLLEGSRSRGAGFMAYAAISFITSVAGLLGLVLLILPGLILIARWSLAGALAVARGSSVLPALAESWRLTRGSTWPIVGFLAVVCVAFAAVLLPLGIYAAISEEAANIGVAQQIVEFLGNIASYGLSALISCGTVALFALLVDRDERVAAVFA